MAHFAKLDKNNIVLSVHVVDNNIATTEQAGIDFLKSLHGQDTNWVQTSYNANFRKNFAEIGGSYHIGLDAFIPECQNNGWHLNSETCQWEMPIPYPQDGQTYYWNNVKVNWELAE